jgi:hypothetical protein
VVVHLPSKHEALSSTPSTAPSPQNSQFHLLDCKAYNIYIWPFLLTPTIVDRKELSGFEQENSMVRFY